jgi:16S rRNA (cytosine967-C5)-methyltransferase
MPINAREAAYRALSKVRRNGAWTEAALNSVLSNENLEERDASLASRIFYGVVQNLALIDFYITSFSSVRPGKMEPQVLDILRLSVYQLVFMSKIPVNAAVHEGVELVKKHANPRASGLCNAVLRKIASSLENLPVVNGASAAERLSIQYSHPLWLTELQIRRLGEESAAALLAADNREAVMTVRVNTQKASPEVVIKALQADQVEAAVHPWLMNCLELRNTHHIERLDSFKNGLFYVQDPAALLAVLAAAPKPGMLVLDGCAAPGGKSFAAALEMANTGRILSCDINDKKLGRIRDGAARLGLNAIQVQAMDAASFNGELAEKADIVLADVPCSGFGVIRKKPEVRYKTEKEIAELPVLQLNILKNLANYVKPGGILLYSTCTLLQRENEEVIETFLQNNGEFHPEAFDLPEPINQVKTGMMTLWPHIHGTDGFFICRLRRSV